MKNLLVLVCAGFLVSGCAALCGNEQPEGPGWVNDVEHIPGTDIAAPPPLANLERAYEELTYQECEKLWVSMHSSSR